MSDDRPRAALEALVKERRSDCAALSRLLGRNPAYVHQFLYRGSPKRLAEQDRRLLAEFFGVDEEMLGAPPRDRPVDRLVPVGRLDLRAAAGAGAFAEGEQPIAHIAFDPGWLRRVARGRPEQLALIRVAGDSMAPTLDDGDDILVDRGDGAERLRDGIYVLRRDEALVVKRLILGAGVSRVTIRSDNPAWPDLPPCSPSALDVVGRVVWTGRRLA
ncbi:S24 family peptidase [Sphingosinicella sp.]|uniref:S24 family peptidase n=1 Tax=Sphingosinicella sp. TaxID=1917971 RepID=UPI0040382E2D